LKKLIILFLQVILIIVSGCGNSHKEQHSPGEDYIGISHPIQESWTVKLFISDLGTKLGVIAAGHDAIYRTTTGDEHHIDQGIRVTFFDVNNHTTTSITAQKAVIHDNQDIELFGTVIITSGNTTVIKTEYAIRTAKDKMIRSDKFVTITRPNETIKGYGFESDQDLLKYRIFRVSGNTFIK